MCSSAGEGARTGRTARFKRVSTTAERSPFRIGDRAGPVCAARAPSSFPVRSPEMRAVRTSREPAEQANSSFSPGRPDHPQNSIASPVPSSAAGCSGRSKSRRDRRQQLLERQIERLARSHGPELDRLARVHRASRHEHRWQADRPREWPAALRPRRRAAQITITRSAAASSSAHRVAAAVKVATSKPSRRANRDTHPDALSSHTRARALPVKQLLATARTAARTAAVEMAAPARRSPVHVRIVPLRRRRPTSRSG